MSEFIEFRKIEEKPKTSVYAVVNKKRSDGCILGIIKWYGAWRKYCFFPGDDMLFETKCMYSIIEFIEKLMKKKKG